MVASRMACTESFSICIDLRKARDPEEMDAIAEVFFRLPESLAELELGISLVSLGGFEYDDILLVNQLSSVFTRFAGRSRGLRVLKICYGYHPSDVEWGPHRALSIAYAIRHFSSIITSIRGIESLTLASTREANYDLFAPQPPLSPLTAEAFQTINRLSSDVTCARLLLSANMPLTYCCLHGLDTLLSQPFNSFHLHTSPSLDRVETFRLMFNQPLQRFADDQGRVEVLAQCVPSHTRTLSMDLDTEDILSLDSESSGATHALLLCSFQAMFQARCFPMLRKVLICSGEEEPCHSRQDLESAILSMAIATDRAYTFTVLFPPPNCLATMDID